MATGPRLSYGVHEGFVDPRQPEKSMDCGSLGAVLSCRGRRQVASVPGVVTFNKTSRI